MPHGTPTPKDVFLGRVPPDIDGPTARHDDVNIAPLNQKERVSPGSNSFSHPNDLRCENVNVRSCLEFKVALDPVAAIVNIGEPNTSGMTLNPRYV